MDQLKNLPAQCVDLTYIDDRVFPVCANSNRVNTLDLTASDPPT